MELRELYGANRADIMVLAAKLAPGEEELPVPATPKWRVRDVVAHQAGVAADVLAERVDKTASDEWTESHVAPRRDVPLSDVVAEWSESGPLVEAQLADLGRLGHILVMDVITHRYDLYGALKLAPPVLAPDAADFEAESFRTAIDRFAGVFGRRLGQAGLPAVRLEGDGWRYDAGEGEPDVTVRASSVEIFRGLAGRRSERQIRDWSWSGDPAPYLELLSPFGPPPAADVVEFAAR